MGNDLEARFNELVKRKQALEKEKASLEGRLSSLNDALEQNYKDLKDQFGVDNLNDAKELYTKNMAEIEAIISKCEGVYNE